ncbi:unnamed protein product [Lactuca virosa]|uniref:Uncharacterized protein n=1 Tax=Lactuca virosa TaxID=75947 RepID=A0AAU9LKX5_9ASTR|nr:unnamed protein product [Lactuca virosa]
MLTSSIAQIYKPYLIKVNFNLNNGKSPKQPHPSPKGEVLLLSTMAFSNPLFSSPLPLSPLRSHAPFPLNFSFTTKATLDDSSSTDGPTSKSPETEIFEDRLSQVRLCYRSGTGKKVDARKSKKSGMKSGGSSRSRANMYLPSVPLKEPISG